MQRLFGQCGEIRLLRLKKLKFDKLLFAAEISAANFFLKKSLTNLFYGVILRKNKGNEVEIPMIKRVFTGSYYFGFAYYFARPHFVAL